MSEERYVWMMKTIQTSPVRTLLTALKDIVNDTNITIQPDGIQIINIDKSNTMLVDLKLDAEKFEMFECKKSKIVISVNMIYLFKLINFLGTKDILTMFISEDDYNDGMVEYLSLKYENSTSKKCKTYRLKLMEPELDDLEFPELLRFSSIISMPSAEFQSTIRELSALSSFVEIRYVSGELTFSCCGSFATANILMQSAPQTADDECYMEEGKKCGTGSGGELVTVRNSTADDGVAAYNTAEHIAQNDFGKIVHGIFSLKNLSYFIKCTPLCSQIEIMFENDLPIIVKYDVAGLGVIKLCTVPKIDA